jgi:hypothetical protein
VAYQLSDEYRVRRHPRIPVVRVLPFELCFVARRAAAVVIDLGRNDDTRIASKSIFR